MSPVTLRIGGCVLAVVFYLAVWAAFWIGRHLGRCEAMRQCRDAMEKARDELGNSWIKKHRTSIEQVECKHKAGWAVMEEIAEPGSMLPLTPQEYIPMPQVKPPKKEEQQLETTKDGLPRLGECPKCHYAEGHLRPDCASRIWVATVADHCEICADAWMVSCGLCGYGGPSAREKGEAIRLWNLVTEIRDTLHASRDTLNEGDSNDDG